jgi:hypothetical protein
MREGENTLAPACPDPEWEKSRVALEANWSAAEGAADKQKAGPGKPGPTKIKTLIP